MTTFYKTASTLTKGAMTLPGKYYKSEAIFASELERIGKLFTLTQVGTDFHTLDLA